MKNIVLKNYSNPAIDWTKITADSATAAAGNVGDSVVADLQTAHDGDFFSLAEVSATPGMDLDVDFVDVTAFGWVNITAAYVANTNTHAVAVQLYDWTDAWDTFDCLGASVADTTTADGYIICNHSFLVPDDSAYIGTGGDVGKVKVRFYHTMGGNAAHDLYIDVVALYKK